MIFLSSDNKRVFSGSLNLKNTAKIFLFIYVVKILKVFNSCFCSYPFFLLVNVLIGFCCEYEQVLI